MRPFRDWIYYKGWGEQEYLEGCTRHRAEEVRTALRMLRAVNARGAAAEHVTASCAQGPQRAAAVLDGLAGRLAVGNAVLCGHSYGGATVAGAACVVSGAAPCAPPPCRSRAIVYPVSCVFIAVCSFLYCSKWLRQGAARCPGGSPPPCAGWGRLNGVRPDAAACSVN